MIKAHLCKQVLKATTKEEIERILYNQLYNYCLCKLGEKEVLDYIGVPYE